MRTVKSIIVIGVSAGGFDALPVVVSQLHDSLKIPVVIIQHKAASLDDTFNVEYLCRSSSLEIREARQLEQIRPATIYVAPGGYHLLINPDKSFSLNVDEPVSFARPSIDVLFETAADVFKTNCIGVILTGANSDGAQGLARIKACGGFTIVQNPDNAYADQMPRAAIDACEPDRVVDLDAIAHVIMDGVALTAS